MRELAWNLFIELRKETLESQRIRAQITGFKITFVSFLIGLIIARYNTSIPELLIIPTIASVFFDFLINSYSFSIKRIGFYCRTYLEPIIRAKYGCHSDILLWEEFMALPTSKQPFSRIGQLGITLLSTVPLIISIASPDSVKQIACIHYVITFVVLLFLIVLDYRGFRASVSWGKAARKQSQQR